MQGEGENAEAECRNAGVQGEGESTDRGAGVQGESVEAGAVG